MKPNFKKWRLSSKHDRRFKQGHPWVYSNELQESPKGVSAGEIVELHDAGGKFLAFGMANPNSLIAFRTLSTDPETRLWFGGQLESGSDSSADSSIAPEFFLSRLNHAEKFRENWFSKNQSYRLLYGEVDGCPGLVVDRYFGKLHEASGYSSNQLVYVVQPHSAGMDRSVASILVALQKFTETVMPGVSAYAVLRRDAGSREKEGLEKLPSQIFDLKNREPIQNPERYKQFLISVSGVMGSTVELFADLFSGQKTGFFLDQLQNIKLVEGLLLRKIRNDRLAVSRGLKILDLCCYVGQWSVHLTQTCIEREALPLSVTLVDASDAALGYAEKNMQHLISQYQVLNQVMVERLKADVLEPMPKLADQSYDVVIADPPALIKNRKHIPQGQNAYVQLMTTAISKVRAGGMLVACSCSQLLSSDDFKKVLEKASRRSGRQVRWIAQGSPSVDHFQVLSFSEGHYLKCWVAQVD